MVVAMPGRLLRTILVLVVLGAVVAKALSLFRSQPAPDFSHHPTVDGGPPTTATRAAAPTASPTASNPAASKPAATDTSWVEPTNGNCPPGYPVKAKMQSGIFHLPGMALYERINPDRCYPSPDAAEADGLRVSKR